MLSNDYCSTSTLFYHSYSFNSSPYYLSSNSSSWTFAWKAAVASLSLISFSLLSIYSCTLVVSFIICSLSSANASLSLSAASLALKVFSNALLSSYYLSSKTDPLLSISVYSVSNFACKTLSSFSMRFSYSSLNPFYYLISIPAALILSASAPAFSALYLSFSISICNTLNYCIFASNDSVCYRITIRHSSFLLSHSSSFFSTITSASDLFLNSWLTLWRVI